ncbi:RagB/SusD family nutrient uptake outer membrane protein [Tenacibaculum sp. Mcav3-52]|uniref:RagB/SusD family nutrient uptake outer membrane protein n=1 Tax=unclassified Tenacibaculum TaxID=2635139 RepID=UPI0012E4C03A|nr:MULTISPECIES: RagB/SusD family nutrient uptake outer membrane protein [unclassified Tenacibaculum]MCG7501675.1 RagB/SusD family nutrient uptake outer membrane protein [Tenacibaculum sp. Mcav3-52]MCO7184963.1 RagB/SusD family nutrient uptake outer membrane protein [Tenacibaculum sp. XPcli2-G]GFD80322.1 membrane protein [Tenacibaculum sp. KUL118]
MKHNKIFIKQWYKSVLFTLTVIFFISCSDLEQEFENERYLTETQAEALAAAGNTQGLKALDGAILSYIRDGLQEDDDDFGLKALELGMDLRSNDMDMSRNTWFGSFNNYDNIITTNRNNEVMWKFCYTLINRANAIINTIPDTAPEEVKVFKYKSYTYRAIAYFYLARIYQHTKASDDTPTVPIDSGDYTPQPKSTLGQIKQLILDDLTLAYNGLKSYTRSTKDEIDANVVAAYLARYYLTYENWEKAEEFADIAMNVGSISDDVQHGFDELSLSEAIWGATITPTTTTVYGSFFSHVSQINDGYSGWNHFKTINSNLYDMIPNTDKRKLWFADKQYEPWTIIVPGTWAHYNITPKYTSLKFIAHPGPGEFIGDYIYLRNTEFYLTKAEALARQGKNSDAQQVLFDLNSVRDPNYVKSTKTGQDLIDEILLYRRIELWGDGVASFDMARNGVGLNRKDGRLNLVMPGADLVIPAMDPKMIYQIPLDEVDANPNL